MTAPLPLAGVRILSLALNLPGPAALMRCRELGAHCTKLEPPTGDPMQAYSQAAYRQLHEGVTVIAADLKSPSGQELLHSHLATTDVLLTSFRPSALARLGLDWDRLQRQHPHLSQVAIVGALGAGAEIPGHDLTYQAEHGLVDGLSVPATLAADMGGALSAVQAVLQLVCTPGTPQYLEVGLSQAAAFLALPRQWGMTVPSGMVGGAHAGYRVYACQDGRVAVAALEPHFARALCQVAGIACDDSADDVMALMQQAGTRESLERFFLARTCGALRTLATGRDLPLHVLPG